MSLLKLVTIFITTMLIMVLSIVFFVVYYQRKITTMRNRNEKELTEAALQAEEAERGRIASELHDDVGAMLASVRLYINLAAKRSENAHLFHLKSRVLIDETIDKVRNLSRSLQPAMLQHLGLQTSLSAFFDIFNATDILIIEYFGDELPELQPNTALCIYRIMQELLNNTLKYANATHIWVRHSVVSNKLLFRFSHNGQGIIQEQFKASMHKKNATGLKNIVNRLKVLDGNISFERDETEYHVFISVPL